MIIYTWANHASIPQRFEINNIDSVTYPGAGTLDGYRDYNAGMFMLERPMRNRWQARLGAFRRVSRQSYTPFARVGAGRINWTGSADIQLEEQGRNRIDALNVLDLRLEKIFSVNVHRFGVYADIENALDASAVLTRNARFPGASIAGNTVNFGGVTAVTAARQITFGARWSF